MRSATLFLEKVDPCNFPCYFAAFANFTSCTNATATRPFASMPNYSISSLIEDIIVQNIMIFLNQTFGVGGVEDMFS
jgi:hypothetical protein